MNFFSNINLFFIIVKTQFIFLETGIEYMRIILTNFMPQRVSNLWFRGNFFRCHIDSFFLATPHVMLSTMLIPHLEEVRHRIARLKRI
jgi:hypothetical protein